MFRLLPYILLLVAVSSYGQPSADTCKQAPYTAYVTGFFQKDTITVNELLAAGNLESSNKAFKVVAFNVGMVMEDPPGPYHQVSCNEQGFKLPAVQELLKKAKPGYTLFIDAITLQNSTGQCFWVPPFKITIGGHPMPKKKSYKPPSSGPHSGGE